MYDTSRRNGPAKVRMFEVYFPGLFLYLIRYSTSFKQKTEPDDRQHFQVKIYSLGCLRKG